MRLNKNPIKISKNFLVLPKQTNDKDQKNNKTLPLRKKYT